MPLKQWKVIAIAAGILLAGIPATSLNFWLDDFILRQGQQEVDLIARRTIALAERRIELVLDSLGELAASGVDSCRSASIDVMRKAVFATTPAKEISVVGADGRTLCTDIGFLFGRRDVVHSQPITGENVAYLEVIRFEDRLEQMVRIRQMAPSGLTGLAALIPTDLFISQVGTQGKPLRAYASMTMRDGVLIAEGGSMLEGERRMAANLIGILKSTRYGLIITVTLPRAEVIAGYRDLKTLGLVVMAAITLLLIIFAIFIVWRQRDNPIAEIERAFKAGEFVPFYQPVVDIVSGHLLGAEILMRWRKPDGTIIAPASFIPLAESSGLILEMTRRLMRKVSTEIGAVIGARPRLQLSFNMTARHFADDRIVEDLCRIFRGSPIQLSQIVLELTERQSLDNLTTARRVIAALQGLGVKVAIDDVGAGHSGLSYILKLGADIIKIDKIFIDAMDSDRNSTAIIETLVDLAGNMRLDIIAEGVENFEQVLALRERGIRAAQGYVFSPPLPGSSFVTLVEAIDPLPGMELTNPASAERNSLAVNKPYSAA